MPRTAAVLLLQTFATTSWGQQRGRESIWAEKGSWAAKGVGSRFGQQIDSRSFRPLHVSGNSTPGPFSRRGRQTKTPVPLEFCGRMQVNLFWERLRRNRSGATPGPIGSWANRVRPSFNSNSV